MSRYSVALDPSDMIIELHHGQLDSIAVSVFADIFIELANTDGKIQITILILRRGALSSSA